MYSPEQRTSKDVSREQQQDRTPQEADRQQLARVREIIAEGRLQHAIEAIANIPDVVERAGLWGELEGATVNISIDDVLERARENILTDAGPEHQSVALSAMAAQELRHEQYHGAFRTITMIPDPLTRCQLFVRLHEATSIAGIREAAESAAAEVAQPELQDEVQHQLALMGGGGRLEATAATEKIQNPDIRAVALIQLGWKAKQTLRQGRYNEGGARKYAEEAQRAIELIPDQARKEALIAKLDALRRYDPYQGEWD